MYFRELLETLNLRDYCKKFTKSQKSLQTQTETPKKRICFAQNAINKNYHTFFENVQFQAILVNTVS